MNDQVELRILGPVEANVTGRFVALGPPKQRALLAALALNAGRTVSTGSLIETLWVHDPPPSAVKNVQLYVWKLRKSLGGLLQRRPTGYCLPPDSVTLDVDEFTSLVRLARQARTDCDPATAIARFTQALDLWRGPALADLITAGIGANLARPLTAERSRVMHELGELCLESGRATDLLARLDTWISEDPLDERLRELHIRALLATGQPAQGLTAYLAAESALDADLGTRPGPALRELSHAARRALGQTDPETVVPQQLPPTIATFAGRRSPLSTVVELLSPRVRSIPVVAIVGPGGIGKSALGIRASHRMAGRFPDGQLYLDLQGASPGLEPLSAMAALSTLLRGIGVAAQSIPQELPDVVRLYRTRTAGLKLLILLDNALDADQARHLIPGRGGSAVLVTARHTLTELDGVTQIHLDPLPTNDAVELLTAAVGSRRLRAEPDAEVSRLVDSCAGLPLALRLAASRLASRPSWSLAAFNDRLADERGRLDEFRQADLALRSSFAVSYRHLTPDAQHVFRCCGLFPGVDFTSAAIAALADIDEHTAGEALESLVDSSLLYTRAPGRYHLHDLTRIYAGETALASEPEDVTVQRFSRLASWYLRTASHADRVLLRGQERPALQSEVTAMPASPVFAGVPDAVAWFEAERRNVREVVEATAKRGLHELAWQLPVAMKGFFDLRRYTEDWIATYQVALESVRKCADPYAHARVLNGFGSAYWRRERFADAVTCYGDALTIIRELGDRRTEAILLANLGGVHGDSGEFEAAIGCLRQALAIRDQVGSQLDESFALSNLGHVYHECGRYDEALSLLDDALQLRRRQGNRHGEAVTLHCLADTLLGLRRLPEADAVAQQALSLCGEQANRYGQGAVLHTIGRIRMAQHRPHEAAAHLREAIAIYREVGITRDERSAEVDLASVSAA